MTWIILLFALGFALIAIEVIIPGGILGAIGGVMIFIGCVLSFNQFGTTGGILTSVCAFTLGGLMLWIEFRILPKTRLGKRAFLTTQITGVSSSYGEDAQRLIGKAAVAMTTLSPSGYIRIDGKRYEAFCQEGHTETGTALKVIGADNFRLIVSSK